MSNEAEYYNAFFRMIYDYQTLISAILAGAAAFISAHVIWRSAKLPLESKRSEDEQRRKDKLRYLCMMLPSELRGLRNRAEQAAGTVKVHIASNNDVTEFTKQKTTLKLIPIIEDWEFMSLLPPEILDPLINLMGMVEDHNFDIYRAGGAFGADNFREQLLTRIELIKTTANMLAGKIGYQMPK